MKMSQSITGNKYHPIDSRVYVSPGPNRSIECSYETLINFVIIHFIIDIDVIVICAHSLNENSSQNTTRYVIVSYSFLSDPVRSFV